LRVSKMDACLITAIIIIIAFVIGLVLIIKLSRRPKFLYSTPNRNLSIYKQEIIIKLENQGYTIKEKENGNVFVQKDTFTATTLVFKQNGSNVDVLYIHSNSNKFLVAFIICFFTVTIVAIILAVIADSKSDSFRNNELKPLLSGYGTGKYCKSCGRSSPIDARICPYCGTPFY
jgi:hypothetical protein